MVGEILFRGKRVDGKGWAYGSLIQMDEYASQSFIFPRYEGASTLPCGHLVSSNMVVVIPRNRRGNSYGARTTTESRYLKEIQWIAVAENITWDRGNTPTQLKNVDILTHGFILGEWEHVWVTGNIHDTRKAPTDAPTSGEQG